MGFGVWDSEGVRDEVRLDSVDLHQLEHPKRQLHLIKGLGFRVQGSGFRV